MKRYISKQLKTQSLRFLPSLLIVLSTTLYSQPTWTDQVYNPNVTNIEQNPMKGWMPGYKGINSDFPYSIDHFYIPLKDVYKDWGECDWTAFEEELDRIVGGGRHVVTRFFIDYPNRPSAMPDFLIDEVGYKVPMYDDNSPDWNDDTLMAAMENFIQLFGARYDGDPRIAFIEAGLYGYWGEWHTYPENSWQMTQTNKDRLLIAYDNAFDTTHIGLRQSGHASTYDLKMSVGYYDDSFAYNTLCSGSWCSWTGNILADGITDNYKFHPFAGELRPQIQNNIFDAWPNDSYSEEDAMSMEDLETCIRTTHLSYMKAYYLFNKIPTATEFENGLRSHKMMGYEFFISSVRLTSDMESNVTVDVNIQNRAVAPFYYNWEVEFAAINSTGNFIGTFGMADWNITTILPDSSDNLRNFTGPIYGNDTYTILMRLVNPLEAYTENAMTLRFANELQDSELEGWLTLGTVTIDAAEVETTGVTIDNCPADSIRAGEIFTFTATVEPFNATNKKVYWHSSDTLVAGIDSTGELMAYGIGSTTIKLYNHDSTLTDVCTVHVSDPAQWPFGDMVRTIPGRIEAEFFDEGGEGIAYHDDENKNGNMEFRPESWVDFNTHDASSNSYVVGWTSDGEWLEYTIAVESGIYDMTLLYHSGASPGSLRVLLDGEVIGTFSGIVNQGNWGIPATTTIENIALAEGNNQVLRLEIIGQGFDIDAIDFKFHKDVTGVSIGSCQADLAMGTTHQLSANLEPADASDQSVTWASSNTGVATVNAAGMVNGMAEGTTVITVTTHDGGFTDQCEITVFKPVIAVTGVSLAGCPEEALIIDNTNQLAATVSPANADNPSVSWSSSNPDVATVNQSGLLTAIAAGTATITVTTTDGGFTMTCDLSVNEPVINVTGVELLVCPSDTLLVDSTYQFTAVVSPPDAHDQAVSWNSSNEAVAVADENGLVTGVSVGETTISVTSDDGGFTDECLLVVEAQVDILMKNAIQEPVHVYFNPLTEQIHIQFPQPGMENTIRMYNLYGQLVWTGKTFDSNLEVSASELPGERILILHIQSPANAVSRKICL